MVARFFVVAGLVEAALVLRGIFEKVIEAIKALMRLRLMLSKT